MRQTTLRPVAVIEIIFDLCYLCFALGVGLFLLTRADSREAVRLCGLLALVLAGGDAFHLLPRVLGLWRGDMAARTRSLGLGKLMTSVTMTLFYVLLCRLWTLLYDLPSQGLMAAALALAAVRIALCLPPQNGWLTPNPPLGWAVARNVPFALLGALTAGCYAYAHLLRAQGVSLLRLPVQGSGFDWMWLAIALSFGFYLLVVLFSQRRPAVGALMLPKTCAYVWMLCMSLSLM